MDRLSAMRAAAEVAEQGGFAAAARALGLAPPSVSRLVSDLEADLGIRLFTRSTRAVAVTEEGEHYLARARDILAEIDAVHASVRERGERPSGRLRITSVMAFGQEVVAPLAAEFAARHPDVAVEIELSNRRVDLVQEHFDIGVRIGGDAGLDDSGLKGRQIFSQRLIFVAAPGLAADAGAVETLDDLSRLPMVRQVSGGWGVTARLRIGNERRDWTPGGRLIVNSPLAARRAVLSGRVAGLVADYLVRDDIAAGRLVRLLPAVETEPQDVWVVFPHRKFMPAKTRSFLDFLVDGIARLGA